MIPQSRKSNPNQCGDNKRNTSRSEIKSFRKVIELIDLVPLVGNERQRMQAIRKNSTKIETIFSPIEKKINNKLALLAENSNLV